MVNYFGGIRSCQIIVLSGAVIEAVSLMQLKFSSLNREIIFIVWLMLPFFLLMFLNRIASNNNRVCMPFSSIFVLCSISYIVDVIYFSSDAQGGLSILFMPIIQYITILPTFLFFYTKKL